MSLCPLCRAPGDAFFDDQRGRVFDRCARPDCGAVFVRPACFLDEAEEAARYGLHDNDLAQEGYRNYLAPLLAAIRADAAPGGAALGGRAASADALDFGCGPTESVARLLADEFRWRVYDKYFAPDETAWSQDYDLIAASEVIEHLREPAAELARLVRHLRPGGSLFVMTQLYGPEIDFARWHYPRDPTHLIFYTRDALARWARESGLRFTEPRGHVIQFRK